MKPGRIIPGLLILVVAVLVGFGFYNHFHQAAAEDPHRPADPAKVKTAKLEDPGPNGCLPGRSILQALRKQKPGGDDFKPPYNKAELDVLATQQIAWVQVHTTKPCVKAMAQYVHVKPDALPKWFKDHELKEVGKDGITVQNSYFQKKGKHVGQIVWWKVQTFPQHELVWYAGDKPTFKYVCGNALRAPKTEKKVAASRSKHNAAPATAVKTKLVSNCTGKGCHPAPPPKHCKAGKGSGGNCTSPPPGCKVNCNHNPPPGCTKNCGPPPGKCIKTPSPGKGYTWSSAKCSWSPPKTPPKKHCPCVTKAQVNQSPQNNTHVLAAAVAPTKTVLKQAPPVMEVKPANNRGSGGTSATKAPDPTPNGSNSGSSNGSGTPSGSLTNGGHTSVGSGSGNGTGHVTDAHGGNNATDGNGNSTGGGAISNPF